MLQSICFLSENNLILFEYRPRYKVHLAYLSLATARPFSALDRASYPLDTLSLKVTQF
jgi:hypothetical protein